MSQPQIAEVLHANGEHTQDWRVLDKRGDPVEPIPTGMQLGKVLDDPIEQAAALLMIEKRGEPDAPLNWNHAVAIVTMREREKEG
jgi:hypothetical protein